jgi:alternative ribosome-rescue factor
MSFQHDKGKIKHNALAALVTSNASLPKKEKIKKGKGSYNRNSKHKSDYSHKRIF